MKPGLSWCGDKQPKLLGRRGRSWEGICSSTWKPFFVGFVLVFFLLILNRTTPDQETPRGGEKKHVKLILQSRLGLWINASDPGGTCTHTHTIFKIHFLRSCWPEITFFFFSFKTNPLAGEQLHQSTGLLVRNDALGKVRQAGSLDKR